MTRDRILYLALSALLFLNLSCASGRVTVPYSGASFVTNILPVAHEDKLDLTIEASGKLQYTIFKLENPKRLVVDLPGVDASAFTAPMELTRGPAWQVSSSYFPQTGNSRINIFLNKAVMYNVTRLADGKILITAKSYGRPKLAGPERELKPGEVEITGIELREVSGLARILVSYRGGAKPVFEVKRRPDMNRMVLDIYNAKVMRRNEKLLSVTAKGSVVKSVALFQFTTEPAIVKVIADVSEFTSSNVFDRDGQIIFDVGSDAILAQTSEIKKEKSAKVRDLSEKKEKRPEDYEGKRITLDFQQANIKNIFRIIADVSDLNLITSPGVTGKVTMKLKNVPWDLALETILKNNKLGMVRRGNIIRIATQEELARENEAMASKITTVEKAEPLYLKVFQVNYETAENLRANLESVKSSRGSIDINSRTNTLIIQDIKGRLAEMERLIEILDKRTVQVLIEARIVEVNHSYAKELGIRWGGQVTKNLQSIGFPSTVGVSGISEGGAGASSIAGGVVDLGTGAATGALNLRLGSVNGTALLDMQLLALQNEGKGRILSMPRITTMNNVEAIIESGREIPYQTTSADGTKTEFKKATLALKVTPHVSPDNYVRLEIEANKDEADFANQLPNSPPPILTKRAKTEVIVKDGHTTVIGGLFKENKSTSTASVPFFSKIPLLGLLFKSKADSSKGEELLIFITPKIL